MITPRKDTIEGQEIQQAVRDFIRKHEWCERCGKQIDEGSDICKTCTAEQRKLNREKRHLREKRKIEELECFLKQDETEKILSAYPHPHAEANDFFEDKTLFDWVQWMMEKAGNTGKIRVLKVIKATVGQLTK